MITRAQELHRTRLVGLLWKERELGANGEQRAERAEAPAVDLRTLLSEMAALRSEIRAETRAARDVREQLEGAQSAFETQLKEAADREAAQREAADRARDEASRRTARALIDLADRLQPAVEAASKLVERPSRWLARRPDTAAHALLEGLELTLKNLGGQLASCGVERIATVDERFDPNTMQALGATELGDRADGVVTHEITAGYRDHRGLLRPAQVVVNKRRGGTP